MLNNSSPIARIRYLLERGRVFNSSGQAAPARPLFIEAWELAQARQADVYAIDAAHMMGIIESSSQQLSWNIKALELAENSPEPRTRTWPGSLYNNIGWAYHDAGQYQEALDIFSKALQWREASGQEREISIARWCVARTLRSLNRFAEALAIQQGLLRDLANSGQTHGYVYEELGGLLLALGRADEAQPHFALAYTELCQDPWLTEREPVRLQRLKELSAG